MPAIPSLPPTSLWLSAPLPSIPRLFAPPSSWPPALLFYIRKPRLAHPQSLGSSPHPLQAAIFLRSGQESGYETDSSAGSTSDSESEEEYGQNPPRPAAPRMTQTVRSRQHSHSDSNNDSGYCSLNEDADDKAQYYDDLLERFRADGPTLANHGENTQTMEEEQEKIWNKFCKRRKLDPVEALGQCDAPLFKAYLVWRVENSRIKKESSIMTYWKILSMVYSQKTASWMKEDVLYDIRNWIHTWLTPTYGLDTSKKEKVGLFVEDLAVLLNHHWIRDEEVFAHERLRVQLAANLIFAGATATRLGALIGQLLYEHLEFQLFPPLPGDQRPRVVLKVNLENIKRSGGESEPKEFAFREDDMLIYDPLIPIMGLAFADGAFVNEFKDPEEIYELVVPPNSDRLRLRWKEEWRRRPVFRDVEDSEEGIRIAVNKALKYQKERGHLVRLGRAIGLEKVLEWYDLRRGSGKKLNEALTPEERNKIMGHRQGDSRVYVQYYMSTFNDVDCQKICFGSAPQHDLIHLAGRLVRHGDAPTALTDQQKFEVNQDPDLVKYHRYDQYKQKADRLSKKLKTERLRRAIKDFHDSVHVEEINRQLNGIKPSDVIAPPTIQYDVPERARVARLFSQAAEVRNRDELHPLRLDLVRTIARLCKRRESPCRRQAKRGRKTVGLKTRAVRFRCGSPSLRRPDLRDNIPTQPATQVVLEAEKNVLPFCPFYAGHFADHARHRHRLRLPTTSYQQREPSRRQKPKGAHTTTSSKTLTDPKAAKVGRHSRTTTCPKSKVATALAPIVPSKSESTSLSTPPSSHAPAPAPVPTILNRSEVSTPPPVPKETAALTGTLLICPFCHRDADADNPTTTSMTKVSTTCRYDVHTGTRLVRGFSGALSIWSATFGDSIRL
ncbi:hypothetical protein B0T26DRAFT_681697 [Lasiosphaeria miniovina]|uniref:FluG domain-containing protein n=1 Tax=Lasiosphaeria miniovina TaxID=1954250 RepID=A0AA39ZPZ9_9PEZI|nr:uncharacterized protein B0T26DRAFT_681697 [Lasiosphaeria miniovina]KAK0701564.1 hypothetical protein B0T26DRAFT_681697 [Lasiosphaeria miniovina]